MGASGRLRPLHPEDYFAGHPDARAVFDKVHAALAGLGPVEVLTTKSQVAFRRGRGFAYLWMSGLLRGRRGALLPAGNTIRGAGSKASAWVCSSMPPRWRKARPSRIRGLPARATSM